MIDNWKVVNFTEVVDENGDTVAHCPTPCNDGNPEYVRAHVAAARARLIAAAPDLVEACWEAEGLLVLVREVEQQAFGDGRRNETLEECLAKLRAALMKAGRDE